MMLLLFLLMPLWGVTSDMTKQTLSAMSGGSILFQVNVSRNIEITSIFWSHTGTGEKRIVAIAKPDQLKVINSRFLNRVNSQQPSFTLKLSNLNEEDGGIYEAQIFTDVAPIYRYFELQVYAKKQSQEVHWTTTVSRNTRRGDVTGTEVPSMVKKQSQGVHWTTTVSRNTRRGDVTGTEVPFMGKNQSQGLHWTWCNILLIISLGIIVNSFTTMT